MFWNWWSLKRRQKTAARMRAEHEAFLTLALMGRGAYPRIPTRRSDEGGFGPMMARNTGRSRADRWWGLAMDKVDR